MGAALTGALYLHRSVGWSNGLVACWGRVRAVLARVGGGGPCLHLLENACWRVLRVGVIGM